MTDTTYSAVLHSESLMPAAGTRVSSACQAAAVAKAPGKHSDARSGRHRRALLR